MIEIVNKFEKLIYAVLMVLLMVVLVITLVDLGLVLFDDLIMKTPMKLDTISFTSVMGVFLLVLIGVELLDTIKAYFIENTIHVEIVVLLAIIAVARKVILLEPPKVITFEYGFELMGIGVIVIGLAASYYLIKKSGITIGPGVKKPE
ncbi:MAG: phosphate-starvation-inducible PsiE family protein [Methanoregula sp.]|nr:phosphate-starvation-inducible PsiE family protein [Methanoregula sp.]